MRILLVEDDLHMAEPLAQLLRRQNYAVDLACDGEYGLDCALSGIYDIIILDVMLPKMDGLAVLKELRREKIAVPVLLLTARNETGDKVAGLDLGADDYLGKPFKTEELLARLRALGRRKGELVPDGILACGDLELNPNTLDVYCGKKSFRLTLKESQLLELLMRWRGAAVSKGAILEKLWGFEGEAEDGHVEVYMSFLRKKLAFLNSATVIRTVRGVGYVLQAEEGGEG